MNSQSGMLVWKEWRERRTQFWVCLAWLVLGTVYDIAYERSTGFRTPVASLFGTAYMYGLLVPIFLAMRTALGETTDRTRAFSDGLPISARRRGWMRLAGGVGVLVTPLVVGALLLSVCLAWGWIEQAPTRPPQDANYVSLLDRPSLSALSAVGLVWRVTAILACSATGLYLVLALLGTTLRAESHLGYAGAAVALLWLLGSELAKLCQTLGLSRLAAWSGALAPDALITNYGYGDARGTYGDLMLAGAMLGPLLVNAGLQVILAAVFVRRYSRRLAGRTAERDERPARRRWRLWPLWLPTRDVALAWLTLRQAVPMCLPGLMLACLMTPFQMDVKGPSPPGEVLQRYTDALPSSMWIVGLLWAVVVGAGSFAGEIDWRIGEFWRTRPIPLGRLFGVKVVVGLLAVLLVLDATVIAATWSSPNWGDYHCMNWAYIACFLPLHATMFAVAVAWTCVLRRAVLGGLAALTTFGVTTVALEWFAATRELHPIEVYNHLGMASLSPGTSADFTTHGYPFVVATMGVIALASLLVGWLALRRYDPQRQAS